MHVQFLNAVLSVKSFTGADLLLAMSEVLGGSSTCSGFLAFLLECRHNLEELVNN